jgi:L-iditol 2-dehydrogenase
MKAAYLIGKMQFEIREVADPATPDDGLVLKVDSCGVCGSDLRRWKEGPINNEPTIPGHEIGGVVESVGPACKGYVVGDRLAIAPDVHCGRCYYCRRGLYNLCDNLRFLGITPGWPGGLAEKMPLDGNVLANGIVHPVPAGMSLETASLAEPCSSVLAAHQHAQTGPDDTVLVMGGGPIGCLHIAVAHARGARVILSEPAPVRRDLAVPFAPEAVIDPSRDDVIARVKELTGGLGADIVICANPVAATQTQAIEVVRKRGRVVLFGGLPKANPMTSLDGNRIHYNEIQVVGAFSYHPVMHELALEWLQRGQIPAEKIITRVLPLDQVAEAFEMTASGNALKVIVKM